MADSHLFEDTFTVTSLNSAKYDRVSRIVGTSTSGSDTTMTLDINSEIYPIMTGETIHLLLANTLSLDAVKKTTAPAAHGVMSRPPPRSGQSW